MQSITEKGRTTGWRLQYGDALRQARKAHPDLPIRYVPDYEPEITSLIRATRDGLIRPGQTHVVLTEDPPSVFQNNNRLPGFSWRVD